MTLTRAVLWTMAVGLVLVGAGCTKEHKGVHGELLGTTKGNAAGLQWSVPARWTQGGDRPMRAATYSIPSAAGDSAQGECAVFYFGNDQGGSVDANIDRWYGQFEGAPAPSRATRQVGGMQITAVEIAGAYLAPGGPMMMATGKRENYRLHGAIVAGPQGSVFFKFTGPAKTVEAARAEFDAMIDSMTK